MASFNGKVYDGSLAFRVNPPNGTNQGSIAVDTPLTVNTLASSDSYYSYRNEWFKTTYGGKTGYVMARWIAITSGGTAGTITTSSGPLNIRSSPSATATVSFTVAKGATVRILEGPVTGFYRIGCSTGTGWGSSSYITLGSGGGDSGGDLNGTNAVPYTYSGAKVAATSAEVYEQMPGPDYPDPVHLSAWRVYKDNSVTVRDDGSTEWYDIVSGGTWRYVQRKYIDVSYSKVRAGIVFGASNMQNGSSGRFVFHLQHYLNRYLESRGYEKIAIADIDGIFGSVTKQKVESFQSYAGLTADGIVGPQTKLELAEYVHNLP